MAKIVAILDVDDVEVWEQGFRTHGELFRSQTTVSPYSFAVDADAQRVVLQAEVVDLDTFLKVLESEATANAMANDGVNRETVQLFVLDKEFHF